MKKENVSICSARNRPMIVGKNNKTGKAVIFQPRCKSWNCPECSIINARYWAWKTHWAVEQLKNAGIEVYFLTLTSHESLKPDQTLWVWPKAWKKLSQRVRYKTGGFHYLLVPERHKDDRMHVHLLETAGLGTTWWKDNARACGLGYQAKEEPLMFSGQAANYVTKYLYKMLDESGWPRNFRRIRKSQSWPIPEFESDPDVTFEIIEKQQTVAETVHFLEQDMYRVSFSNHSAAWEILE